MANALSDRPQPQVESQAKAVDSSAEADFALAEKLLGIIDRSGIAVNTYMSGDIIKGANYGLLTATWKPGSPGAPGRADYL